MKKTNIILAIILMAASIATAQQTFTNVALQAVGTQAAITFTLPSEVNTTNFRVEASNNGTDYKVIAIVPSKGNSVLPRTYTHRLYETGYKYYRVARVTMNGSFIYSQHLETKNDEVAPQIHTTGMPTQTLATNLR
ncbi:MAG: hypothetical protein KF744_09895 [Taibaiella sp.]|nr:hypothetical protein [Taibaiella sp.]